MLTATDGPADAGAFWICWFGLAAADGLARGPVIWIRWFELTAVDGPTDGVILICWFGLIVELMAWAISFSLISLVLA